MALSFIVMAIPFSTMQDKTAYWKNNTHRDWWRDRGLRMNTAWVVLLYLGGFLTGYDSGLLTGLQAMPQWNKAFNNPSGTRLGFITASLYIGQILPSFIIPWLCDTYGRKVVILCGSIGCVVGAITACFAQTETMFIAGRVIIGVFCVAPFISCTCLINELVHPRLRGISSGLSMTSYSLGKVIAAWLTFGCIYWDSDWSWRLPTLFEASGPVILIIAMIFCPESPRFLVSKGRDEEALRILAKYHANGEREDELVQQECREISMYIQRDRANSIGSWRSLVATSGNRHRMMIMCISASGYAFTGVSLITLYLAPMVRSAGITNSAQIAIINGALSLFNLLFCFVGGLCVDRVGRRSLFLISTTGIFVTYVMIIGLAAEFSRSANPSIGIAFVVVLFLCCGTYDIAWVALDQCYSAEVLTFSIRGKALSFKNAMRTVCLAVGGFVNPIGLGALQWKFYFVYLIAQAIYLFLIWWLFLETKGRTIEQVSMLFEPEEPVLPRVLITNSLSTKNQANQVGNDD
ncbi:MFS general substrate transporter [Gymnopus androsaceus JB14]|uniref:MFS general substrate transporter n=1 Tax=Gymnopus androsaceus JB14 TaxID=1447944 RepID=A0A6A4HK64_9AGAR|nr:MFS general substrate transporter [Gymnopus androsaceus JB14]